MTLVLITTTKDLSGEMCEKGNTSLENASKRITNLFTLAQTVVSGR